MTELEPPSLPRSPTLVKNMISGLSYGALNASYQVTGCPAHPLLPASPWLCLASVCEEISHPPAESPLEGGRMGRRPKTTVCPNPSPLCYPTLGPASTSCFEAGFSKCVQSTGRLALPVTSPPLGVLCPLGEE